MTWVGPRISMTSPPVANASLYQHSKSTQSRKDQKAASRPILRQDGAVRFGEKCEELGHSLLHLSSLQDSDGCPSLLNQLHTSKYHEQMQPCASVRATVRVGKSVTLWAMHSCLLRSAPQLTAATWTRLPHAVRFRARAKCIRHWTEGPGTIESRKQHGLPLYVPL